jgi:hypothetical protein
MSESPEPGRKEVEAMSDRIRRYAAEALIGLLVAGLLIVIAATTVTTVHFVYQGF